MHLWLLTLLVMGLLTTCKAMPPNTDVSQIQIAGLMTRIRLTDNSYGFEFVIHEYKGKKLYRQSICLIGSGTSEEAFDPQSEYKCYYLKSNLILKSDGTHEDFATIAKLRKKQRTGGFKNIVHTFDLKFSKFDTLNQFEFSIRRIRDFKEENWSESVKVLAASLRSIADTYFTSSIWVPDDEDMKVVKGIR